ncbi:nuclear transport factor 2 family protein [soil metagenome]
MYHALVRRKVTGVFDQLSTKDYPSVLAGVADDVHHTFSGDHPLGGERRSRMALERWFERLYNLCPSLRFEVGEVIAKGWPWRTVVAVQWEACVTPQQGEPYVNHGVHLLRIRWGRVVSIHAYEDSQKVAAACRRMAEAGIEEAAARPITDELAARSPSPSGGCARPDEQGAGDA